MTFCPVEDEPFNYSEDDLFFEVAEDQTETMSDQTDARFEGMKPSMDTLDENKLLYPGASVSIGVFMLLMAVFFTKHNLVGDAIQQLLNIFSLVLPTGNNVCSSLYSFKQYFCNLKNPIKYHYYCPNCLHTVENQNAEKCTIKKCSKSFRGTDLPYFLQIPIIEQVQTFFAQTGFYESLQGRFMTGRNNNTIADIYDGELYKTLVQNNGPLSQPENLSFVLNTDGAPVFKSSNMSIWPVFLTINELELKQRMLPENLILAGLWFGGKKPLMSTFLEPLLQEFKQLAGGINCYSPERGHFTFKGYLLCATADLPAKALLCNCVQYNGDYSCWKCIQKGVSAARGKGHSHVFPFQKEDPQGPKRTIQNVLSTADEVIKSRTGMNKKQGIKGPSWLAFCPTFDIVNGMGIDYMHGVLLGVQKLLLRLWFMKEFSSYQFNISFKLKIVDNRLLQIRPTLDISRLPRTIENDLKYWKASEFQNFLLFYGLPVLYGLLDDERFLHFSLLVHAVHILLKSSITRADLEKADRMLLFFCEKFQILYDLSFMTLNVHQLLHLADNVKMLGPLYTHSCFPFEDKNGLLLKMIRGTQNIDQQIVTGVSFLQKLPELKRTCVAKGSYVETVCHSIDYPNVLKRKKEIKPGVYILGGTSFRTLKSDALLAFKKFLDYVPSTRNHQTFNRIDVNGLILYGTEYGRMQKRDNSTVLYKDGLNKSYGKIKFFILTENETSVLAMISCLHCKESSLKVEHIAKVEKTENLKVISVDSILQLCIAINFENDCYVCTFPNTLQFT